MTSGREPNEWFGARRVGLSGRTPFLVAGTETVTYEAIDNHAVRFATMLDAFDIASGEPVMVISNDPTAIAHLSIAVMRSGRALCVVDPTATPREIREALVIARPTLVLASAEVIDRCELREDCVWTVVELAAKKAKTLAGRLFAKRKSEEAPTTWPAVVDNYPPAEKLPDLDGEATALIIFTSGSTSRPKGVELSWRAILSHFETLSRVFDLEGSVVHNVLPLSHVDGLIEGPLMTYFNAARWVRPCEFSIAAIPELLDSVHRERVTHMLVVPTMLALYDRLASDVRDAFAGDDFKMIVSSAGQLPTALWKRFESTFETTVCNSYGLSETVTSSIASGPPASGTRQVGSIGKPIDCDVMLVDEQGQPVNEGAVGEITITGDHVFSRYRGDPESTNAVLSGRTFHTGDLAMRDADGFIHLQGRKSRMIIRGGRNISPVEIDDAIGRLDGITQSATIGIEDAMWGQRVESAVVVQDPLTADEILEHCRAELAAHKVPQRVLILDELPQTASGKIDMNAVHDRLVEKQTTTNVGSGIDEVVLANAARIFGLGEDKLSLSSAIGEIDGWDSLAHLDLVAALEDHFSIEMSNADILGVRTLGDAVEAVRSNNS